MGRTHRPFFRVCAMDSRAPRNGRVIEELGTYDPFVPETDARAILKSERIDYWVSVGAKPTPKVAVLIRKYGTEGSHLDQQKEAIERLGTRRQKSINEAISAASNLPAPPPIEPEAPAEAPAEEAAGEATDAAAEAPKEEAAAAEEAPKEEAPKEEAADAEAPKEEAAAEETKEEAPAEEASKE